jgi:hypothetical protein
LKVDGYRLLSNSSSIGWGIATVTNKPEKRILVLSATEFQIGTIPTTGDVVFRFDPAQGSADAISDLDLSFRVSATEARKLGKLLIQMADDLQGKPS